MDSFCERSTLANDGNISDFGREARWNMNWNISMSFFISVIFGNIVKVISSDNNGSLHFCRNHDTFEYFSSNWDVASEGTFFINVVTFNSFLRCFESQSNIFKVSNSTASLLSKKFFRIEEDIILFLECSFVLKLNNLILDYQPLCGEDYINILIY